MQDIIKRITLQHGWENRPLVLDEIRGSLRVKVLAGGVVAKAVGEFGLLVPVDKKAAGEPPHEKEQEGADECSAAD